MRGVFLAAALAAGALPACAADRPRLAAAVNAPAARDAIARVAYAEAAGQGDAGLAGVVFTILNRVESGDWGASVESVVNARGQFEPVMRVGGDWRGLPLATAAQRARIDTILNLTLEGRLPDPTGGARYFQNPAIVAQRARDGTVSPGLVHFGGTTPSAVIGDHAFYVSTSGGAPPERLRLDQDAAAAAGGPIFVVGPERAGGETSPAPASLGERGLFVLSNGEVVTDARQRQRP